MKTLFEPPKTAAFGLPGAIVMLVLIILIAVFLVIIVVKVVRGLERKFPLPDPCTNGAIVLKVTSPITDNGGRCHQWEPDPDSL